MPYALDKVPQFEGSVSDWAEKMTRYLERQTSLTQEVQPRSVLLTHQIASVLSRATVDGLLMYSPVDASPVASIGGAWVPLIGPGYYGDMVWSGEWAAGTYPPKHVVTDWPYLMISNKETDDRPAPQNQGEPVSVYQGTSPLSSILAKTLYTATTYYVSQALAIRSYRVYVVAGNNYSAFMRNETTGVVEQLWSATSTLTGWREITASGNIIATGTSFTIGLYATEPDPTPVIYALNYDYTTPNNEDAPGVGVMIQATRLPDSLRANKTDQTGDQWQGGTGPLAQMTPGDTITGAGMKWAIQTITEEIDYIDFTVAPAQQGTAGVQNFTFETVTATPIDTVLDPDYYATYPHVQSEYSVDGGATIASQNAFGIDVAYQLVSLSEDWDIMAVSGGAVTNEGLFAGVTSVSLEVLAGIHVEVVPGGPPVLSNGYGIVDVARQTDARYVVHFDEPRLDAIYHVDISPQSDGSDIITPVIYGLTNSYFSVKFMGGAPGQPRETPPVAFTVRIT